jgi:hypothetical protein
MDNRAANECRCMFCVVSEQYFNEAISSHSKQWYKGIITHTHTH